MTPRQSSASLGLLFVVAVVLIILCSGEQGASARSIEHQLKAEASQASATTDELEYRIFFPLVMGTRPLTSQERYGFVALTPGWRTLFGVERLGAGWYVDGTLPSCATSPGGMYRALLIRVQSWKENPRLSWLQSLVDSHPRSLWLVGNEPDCIWQDDLLPEDYADVYHEIFWAIKSRDPSALVFPGGIVQPTPLRLEWLDRVLSAYRSRYGALLPVDGWNIHNQILQEVEGEWGADIPPGIDVERGVIRDPWDNYSVDIFKEQIWDFREWMASRGYGGRPLIITEFGVLMPEGWWGYDADDVNAFMDATFSFLRTATSKDPRTMGDLSDGYRLVQRWAWYSLDDIPYDPSIQLGFNGNLFDPYTTYITGYGLNFAEHTALLSARKYVELRPSEIRPKPLGSIGPGGVITSSVQVQVQNLGTLGAGSFVVRLAYNGPTIGQLQLPVTDLAGGSSLWLQFELGGLSAGGYTLQVSVDPYERIAEATECDNQLTSAIFIPSDVRYFPLIFRKH